MYSSLIIDHILNTITRKKHEESIVDEGESCRRQNRLLQIQTILNNFMKVFSKVDGHQGRLTRKMYTSADSKWKIYL